MRSTKKDTRSSTFPFNPEMNADFQQNFAPTPKIMSQLRSDPRVAPIFRVGPTETEDINVPANYIIVHENNDISQIGQNQLDRAPTMQTDTTEINKHD